MNFRDILMAAATQGGGGAASPYGPECIANGDFALAGPPPTLFSGATISGGQLHTNGSSSSQAQWTSLQTLTAGTYRCSVDVIDTDATDLIGCTIGGTNGNFTGSDAPGHYEIDVVTTASNQIISLRGPDTVASLDNFSVKRVN